MIAQRLLASLDTASQRSVGGNRQGPRAGAHDERYFQRDPVPWTGSEVLGNPLGHHILNHPLRAVRRGYVTEPALSLAGYPPGRLLGAGRHRRGPGGGRIGVPALQGRRAAPAPSSDAGLSGKPGRETAPGADPGAVREGPRSSPSPSLRRPRSSGNMSAIGKRATHRRPATKIRRSWFLRKSAKMPICPEESHVIT